jgi:hypothetical protein
VLFTSSSTVSEIYVTRLSAASLPSLLASNVCSRVIVIVAVVFYFLLEIRASNIVLNNQKFIYL